MISFLLISVVTPFLLGLTNASSLHDDHGPQRFLKSTKSANTSKCDKSQFSNMFVFGDSLSDRGNIASLPVGIPAGFFTNGKFAVEYIADELGIDLQMSNHLVALSTGNFDVVTGNNYAVGGARAIAKPDRFTDAPVQMQVFMAVQDGKVPSDALYLVMVGGNDVLERSYDDRYRTDKGATNPDKTDEEVFTEMTQIVKAIIDTLVQPLIDAGARDIVVANTPPVHMTSYATLNQPADRAANVEQAARFFNEELERAIHEVECLNDMNIVHYQQLTEIYTLSAKLGLQSDSPCTIGFFGIPASIPPISILNNAPPPSVWDTTCVLPDAPGFASWDELHPTTAVHKLVAEQILDQIGAEICHGIDMKPTKKACKSKTSKHKGDKSSKGSKGKTSKGKKDNTTAD